MFHYRKLTKHKRDHNAGDKGQESSRAYKKANTLRQIAKMTEVSSYQQLL